MSAIATTDDTESIAAPPQISLLRALVFPFTRRNWPLTLSYLALLQYVPIIGWVILRGWRFDLARRIGSDHAHSLPDWRGIREHWRQGWILLAATCVHYLPMWIAAWRWRREVFGTLFAFLQWWYTRLVDSPTEPFPWETLTPGLHAIYCLIALLILYPPLINAVLETGVHRYADTGRWQTLYEFWKNIWCIGENFGDVLRIELGILGLNLCVWTLSLILLFTIGGAFLIPPIMFPIYMWTRGVLMGQWIRKGRWEAAHELTLSAELARVQSRGRRGVSSPAEESAMATEDEEDILSWIRSLVWSGEFDQEEVAIVARDHLGELDEAGKRLLVEAIQSEFEAKRKAEVTWPKVTDFDRLDRAFTILQAQGIIALHRAGYTQSDGVEEVAEAYHEAGGKNSGYQGHCFYTEQDQENALDGNGIDIGFGHLSGNDGKGVKVGQMLRAALEREEFEVEWDGTINARIFIKGFRWQRRSPGW